VTKDIKGRPMAKGGGAAVCGGMYMYRLVVPVVATHTQRPLQSEGPWHIIPDPSPNMELRKFVLNLGLQVWRGATHAERSWKRDGERTVITDVITVQYLYATLHTDMHRASEERQKRAR